MGVVTFSFTLPMTRLAIRGGIGSWYIGIGRAAVAGVLSIIVLALRRPPRPRRGDWVPLSCVIAGVVFGFPVLSAIALHRLPAVHGSVVTGLLPLATAGIAVVRAGERPSVRYWTCSLIGLGAVVVYALDRGGGTLQRGDLLMIAALLIGALGYVEGAVFARTLGGWQVICWALALSLPISIPVFATLAATADGPTKTSAWFGFGYTCVFSMFLGFFAWYAGLARAGIARGGQLQLLQPVLSILWAWPILGEHVDGLAVGASLVVLTAVAVGRNAPVAVTARSGARMTTKRQNV
jgi:drug/metabolite transporter (DMT)-like permease